MQFEEEIEPFGMPRIRMIEYCQHILRLKNSYLTAELFKTQFPSVLFVKIIFYDYKNLLEKFPMNNFLHQSVLNILKEALEGESAQMLEEFVFNSGIVDIILRSYSNISISYSDTKSIRKPFLGIITKIANLFITIGGSNDQLRKYLSCYQGWNELVEGELKEFNERETKNLGGPTSNFMNFEEEEIDLKISDKFSSYSSLMKNDDGDDQKENEVEFEEEFEREEDEEREENENDEEFVSFSNKYGLEL